MQGSKIRLSDAEKELFTNADVILTKNSIIRKTILLLSEVQDTLLAETATGPLSSTPKISKGENYLGLPYVVLDYPRISNEANLFFIRSMFWWGHFFSSTLQLAGSYKERYGKKLAGAYETLAQKNYFIGISEDPWQHHFEATNAIPVSSLSLADYEKTIQRQEHIKIAARWPLSEWESAAIKLTESWKLLSGLIS